MWHIISVVYIVSAFVAGQFESQYLGHHYTREEYNKFQLGCDTTICLNDAQRLLLAATQNRTVEPCDDFKEFSVGRFNNLGALNERYNHIGFLKDVKLLEWERYRKVLAAPINETDIKPFKIAKNYFQKCVNSDNVRVNGTAEVLNYVKSFGGAPFLDYLWDEDSFNVEELFEKNVEAACYEFLNQWVQQCPHPEDNSRTIICLKTKKTDLSYGVVIDQLVQMFKQLNIDQKPMKSLIQSCETFTRKKIDLSNIDVTPVIFTISQLNNYTDNAINWLKIINSQLTSELQLTDESEIFIMEPEVILKMLELMKVTPKRILANIFALRLLYDYKELFLVYSFDDFQKRFYGRLKSYQRWEQCMRHLLYHHGPALEALHAKKYFNVEVQDSVKDFTKEAVHDFIAEVNKLDIDNDTKQDLVAKLKTIKYAIGYPEEVLDLQKVEEFYEELDLNGTEGLVETYLKMEQNTNKINKNPNTNWKKKLIKMLKKIYLPTFITDDNILYIPPRLIHYPYYHPNRSRFFNTATLFVRTVEALEIGVKSRLDLSQFHNTDAQNIGFLNYVKWEESGGKELQLPGFFLTNRQMFWLADAHTSFMKHHPHNYFHDEPMFYLFLKNFHLYYKGLLVFRQTFNCSEMVGDEKKEYELYKSEFDKLEKMGEFL
ncbi:unnamed protein product [Diamesa tonsa]